MNIIDIINKKRRKEILTKEELNFAFFGYLYGDVPDYQMSALLMAICIQGMNDTETIHLTDIFINSGEMLDLDFINGVKVDKHSTGGVGDKITLVIGPIVAACGVKVPKMSGRSLGWTGGTIDKLESIPGFETNLDQDTFIELVNKVGFAVTSQTKDLTPLDKKVYALRDVTGTTESIALIAASIMSKKIAGGADKILIDVKVGKGALVKTKKEAEQLSEVMIKIGKKYNREVKTIITNMNVPLGHNIGNSLEVLEAIEVLQGKEKESYLVQTAIEIASKMVSMGKRIPEDAAKKEVLEVIENGLAHEKFLEFVKEQGGNIKKISVSIKRKEITSSQSGTVTAINALKIGELSVKLGAGRVSKEDKIDHKVGIVLHKVVGDKVKKGEKLCTLYLGDKIPVENIEEYWTIEEII